MADETAICAALAGIVGNISGLRVYPNFVAQVNPPFAVIMPGRNVGFKYDTLDQAASFNFRVEIGVQYVEDASSIGALQAYLATSGPSSIYAQFYTTQRVAGAFDSVLAAGFIQYGLREWAAQQYFMATIPLTVLAT